MMVSKIDGNRRVFLVRERLLGFYTALNRSRTPTHQERGRFHPEKVLAVIGCHPFLLVCGGNEVTYHGNFFCRAERHFQPAHVLGRTNA